MASAMWGLVFAIAGSYYIGDYGYPSYYSEWAHYGTGTIAIILCYTVIHLVGQRENGDAQLKREFGIMRHPDGIVEYVRISDYRAMEQAEIEAHNRREES
jgi:hypothetical protein